MLFELVDGDVVTPLWHALRVDTTARTRLQALTLSPQGVTVLFDHVGPATSVEAVRQIVTGGQQPCVLHADILIDEARHLRFLMTWRRPTRHDSDDVSLEHILLDHVGAGGLLFGRVENGVISYKVASPSGRGLSEFIAAAQTAFGGRFRVRPLRAGPFRPGWEIDDAPRRFEPDEAALLTAALASGYYDEPKRCGVRELGDALGVSKSVVARRLRELERRALEHMVS